MSARYKAAGSAPYHLHRHAEAEQGANAKVGLQPEHVVRAAEDVQWQRQPRQRHAHHIQRPQRLPRLMVGAVQDLRHPEAVHGEHQVLHVPVAAIPQLRRPP